MTATEFNASAIPYGRENIARMIVTAFADAGLGNLQQLAALANAIAESNLDPKATGPDQGVGLFQLNRVRGLGIGHTVAELEDPAINTNIIVAEAKKAAGFGQSASLEDAVSAFVRHVVVREER